MKVDAPPVRPRIGSAAEAPDWLLRTAAFACLGTFAFLALEVFVFRRGYALGDETLLLRKFASLDPAEGLKWSLGQGSIQAHALQAWVRLTGFGLARLHAPALGVLALEWGLLWALGRRWLGAEAAAWAVLADALCAATWMRGRSVLSHAWLPVEVLALALLAGRVRGRAGATAWGLAAAALTLDYEGAAVALPFAVFACFAWEPALRRRWGWSAAGFALGMAALAAYAFDALGTSIATRRGVNLGPGTAAVARAFAANLGGLAFGGRPVPYLGVALWPAVAAWALPLGIYGCWSLRKGTAPLSLVAWALGAVALTQWDTAPWGLPSQRIVAAWPALCLVAGAGGAALRARAPRIPVAFWLALLAFGTLAEVGAFEMHMASQGRRIWGHSALLEAAAQDARAAAREGKAVETALAEVRAGDVRLFVEASSGAPGRGAWVLLPAELKAAAAAQGLRTKVYREDAEDVPVLAAEVGPAQEARFAAMEKDLRPLLADAGAPKEEAWLRRAGAGDDWAYAIVLDRRIRRLWRDSAPGQDLMALVAARPQISPGPAALLGRYELTRDPLAAAGFLDRALAVDPMWVPALEDEVTAHRRLGDEAGAERANAAWVKRLQDGAWRDYE